MGLSNTHTGIRVYVYTYISRIIAIQHHAQFRVSSVNIFLQIEWLCLLLVRRLVALSVVQIDFV